MPPKKDLHGDIRDTARHVALRQQLPTDPIPNER